MTRHEYGFRPAKALGMVPMLPREQTARSYLSLSQSLRRLAHRAKREALDWEAQGHHANYVNMRLESDQCWRRAKFYLNQARIWSE